MKTQFHKTVIINRAVPGSGKTTIARCITQALQGIGLQVVNHSTDEFFMHGDGTASTSANSMAFISRT